MRVRDESEAAIVCRYSSIFKMHVIAEVESGKLTIDAARRKYGISGAGTIQNWLRRYGKGHLLPKVVRVQHPEERDQVKLLQVQLREMESALAQSQVKILALESLIEVAQEHYHADFKKNFGRKPCNGQESAVAKRQRE